MSSEESCAAAVRRLLKAWRRDVESEPLSAELAVPVLRRRWLNEVHRSGAVEVRYGADSVMPLGERMRRLERSMTSASAGVEKLVDHYGLARTTDEMVDRVLAAETATGAARARAEYRANSLS